MQLSSRLALTAIQVGIENEMFEALLLDPQPKDLEGFFRVLCERYGGSGGQKLATDFEMGATSREKASRWVIEDDNSLER